MYFDNINIIELPDCKKFIVLESTDFYYSCASLLFNDCLCACMCAPAGVFWRQLRLCPRDGGIVMAEGRWEEIVEKTVLPSEGVWHLLRSQRKSQGACVFHWKDSMAIYQFLM